MAQGASTYILKSSNASGEEAFGRQTGLNNIKWGGIETPTDPDGAIWLQFRPSNPSAFIPAWKVLAGENDPNEVAGIIILVGTSAPGLNDLRATPLDAALPGVEIHAQAIEHVLSGRSLSRPDYAVALEILLVMLLGAALGAVLPRLSAGAAALLGASIIVAIFVGGWLAYNDLHLLLDPSYPALGHRAARGARDALRLPARRAAARAGAPRLLALRRACGGRRADRPSRSGSSSAARSASSRSCSATCGTSPRYRNS